MQESSRTCQRLGQSRLNQRSTLFKLSHGWKTSTRTGQMCLKEKGLLPTHLFCHWHTRTELTRKQTYSPTSELLVADSGFYPGSSPVLCLTISSALDPGHNEEGKGVAYWRNKLVASSRRTVLLIIERKGTTCNPPGYEICPRYRCFT